VTADLPAALAVALIAVGCAVPVGLAGAVGLRLLGHRSITASISVVALVGTASVVAGVVGTASAMFLSAHDLRVVLLVAMVAGVVALTAALLLGRRLARQSVWERLAAERERTLEASRRELVARVSHDLRTPLAGLRAMAEALEDGVVAEPRQVAAYHTALRREADRLAGMVDDLFELSRIQAGALRLQLEAVPLGDLVSDAVAAVGPAAARKRVQLLADGAAAWPTVLGSDAELGRVLRNLLANAVRHTPADGAVVIAAGTTDPAPAGPTGPAGAATAAQLAGSPRATGTAWLSVQDGCGGIPDTDLPRLFDVAFRGEAARTPTDPPDPLAGGAGLGLAIARGLVEAHQGSIAVQNVGGGCRFVVQLPATR
jgi:signal transduction histidine kinase